MKSHTGIFLCGLGGILLLWSCGNEGTLTGSSSSTGGGGGSDVTLTGTVATPTSTSKSVSIGPSESSEESSSELSISKGSMASSSSKSEQIIVTKAVSDQAPSSGTCRVQLLDGTLLDTCVISSGVLSGCNFNTKSLDSLKQVELVCTAQDKKVSALCDCSDCTNGGTLNCGQVDSSTTTSNLLLHGSVDSSATPENKTSTFKTSVSNGTLKSQVYKTLKEEMGLSDATVGADNTKNAVFTAAKALKACMAGLSNFDFQAMSTALQGGLSSCQGFDSSLAGADLTSVSTVATKAGSGFLSFFKDSTTASKWSSNTALQKLAQSFGSWNNSEMQSLASNPANARELFNKYATDFSSGVKGALDQLAQGGKSFGQFVSSFGTTNIVAGQVNAAKALFDKMNFGGANQTTLKNLGASIFSQIKACDTESEWNQVINNPGQFATTILRDPSALASDDGTIAQRWVNQIGTGGSLTNLTPCHSNTDCPSGQTCSSLTNWCAASNSGKGDGAGTAGSSCSQNSDCTSNSCLSGFCNTGTIGLKLFGQTCTTTADCVNSLTCSSGTCGFGSGGGGGGSTGPNLCIAWKKGGSNTCFGSSSITGTGTASSGTCGGSSTTYSIPLSGPPGNQTIAAITSSGTCTSATLSGGTCSITTCTATRLTLGCTPQSGACTLDLIPQ